MTAPHIGNTGVNDEDPESARIWVAGYVVRDPSPRSSSNWRAAAHAWTTSCATQGVVGISGVDTRALTRHLRERGAMRVGISSVDDRPAGAARAGAGQPADGRRRPDRRGDHRGSRTSCRRWGSSGSPSPRSTSGIKAMTPAPAWPSAASRCTCCPRPPRAERAAGARRRRRVLLQRPRRPGDRRPRGRRWSRAALDRAAAGVRHLLRQPGARPGARLRHLQAEVTATAASTSRCWTAPPGRVEITAHNHGFAVDAPRRRGRPRRRTAGSRSATSASTTTWSRGCAASTCRRSRVQYHPEAAAGPHDAAYLFDRFADADATGTAR